MLAAILFDLDGTIANTDRFHMQAWQQMLHDYHITVDEIFYRQHISGKKNQHIVEQIFPELSPEAGEQLAKQKESLFRQLATQIKPLAGLLELLQWTKTQGLGRSLVTNAPRDNVDFMLNLLNLTETFSPIILGEEAPAPKPHPDPYLMALEKLGLSPKEAIVFEDSLTGIRSAVAAGIQTIGIASTHEPNTLKNEGATMVVADFTDSQLWAMLDSLTNRA
ncbi:hydrolase [Planktothricoides sp. SR001]|uniref:HAD family hydrolase n=1 Tax=Planktothricoides sp. SR001 TaxID=1705388 RepID=UPI0006C1E3E8|nr:HAD-IA family hydrolase [Planktothricoides sp. SR001]KOR36895.1 hydrolase [Planktothricoides sp. SR001]